MKERIIKKEDFITTKWAGGEKISISSANSPVIITEFVIPLVD